MSEALPLFFVSAMGLSLLLYVILDGFDLGVGMLLPFGTDTEKTNTFQQMRSRPGGGAKS